MAARISVAEARAQGLVRDCSARDAGADAPAPRKNKFGAKRTPCGQGHVHASKAEARRCDALTVLERVGHIRNLEQQPRYFFVAPDGRRVVDDRGQAVRYTADFRYEEARKGGEWHAVTEEVKGPFRDAAWRLRRAFFRFFHPDVELREVP